MLMLESWGHPHWQEAGSLCLQGWSCYAQTWHVQSELINSYTLYFNTVSPQIILYCGAQACDDAIQNQSIWATPVIMNSPRSPEALDKGKCTALSPLGVHHSLFNPDSIRKFVARQKTKTTNKQQQKLPNQTTTQKRPILFCTALSKGFYFCFSCFWPWAEIFARA